MYDLRYLIDNLSSCKRVHKFSLFPTRLSAMELSVMSQLIYELKINMLKVICNKIFTSDHLYDSVSRRALSIEAGLIIINYFMRSNNYIPLLPESGMQIYRELLFKYNIQ